MTQPTTYQPETLARILAGIDHDIRAVEADYKAALAVAAERLQVAQRGSSGQGATPQGRVLVEEAPPELDSETAVALHTLETRLDQLNELRDWIKIDPDVARFVAVLLDAQPRPAAFRLDGASATAQTVQTVQAAAPTQSRGFPAAVVALIALLALVAGWLLSIALPAASLLPR